MTIYNGYPISFVAAVTLHGLVLGLLLYLELDRPPDIQDVVKPQIVKALFVDENPQLKNARILEQQRLIRLDEQRQQQARADTQRREQQEREVNERREIEAAALRERQLRERQKAENLKREQEVQQEREREAKRQADERARQQQLAEEREKQRKAEEAAAAAAAAELATTDSELVQAYTAVIHDLVQRNWSRPPSARNGMVAVARIRMLPSGDVQDVEIVRSSGDAAFDRAAETAIYRVGRFRELQGMPINLFNANFRSFLLTFRPEDLLN